MAETDPSKQSDATILGTPLDYSESVYRFYLEVADCRAATRRLIEEFLPQHHAAGIVDLDYVFEPEMPIQCAPDLDSQASVEALLENPQTTGTDTGG